MPFVPVFWDYQGKNVHRGMKFAKTDKGDQTYAKTISSDFKGK